MEVPEEIAQVQEQVEVTAVAEDLVAEKIEAEIKHGEDNNYMIERIIVAIKAGKMIKFRKEIEYMKYRLRYSNNADFEGYFKCQKPEEIVHEVNGTWKERK